MDQTACLAGTSPRLEFPNVPRWDCVSDYIQSKDFSATDKIYPEFDVVRMDEPKNSLALAEVKLQVTEKLLSERRKSMAVMRSDLDKHWKILEEKEHELRKSFALFDAFVKENSSKRERALKKMIEDKMLLEEMKEEIETSKKEYLQIKSAKQDMDEKIKEYRLYENYLNKYVDASKEFESSQELINRYLSLLGTKNYLAVLQESNLRALESAKSDMMKLIEEKNFILMGLNNQIAALQSRFENSKIKSLECEQLVLQIKNNAVIKLNETEEIKVSIWNIYSHMVISKKEPIKLAKDNVEEQMLYVKRTLAEIAKVNLLLRKKSNKSITKKERKSEKME